MAGRRIKPQPFGEEVNRQREWARTSLTQQGQIIEHIYDKLTDLDSRVADIEETLNNGD